MLANNKEIVAALYLAYFDRPAEPKGLDYWTGQLASGKTIFDIAASFSTTREAREIYPDLRNDHVSNIDAFLFKSFNNIFNRAPTAGDTAYWHPAIENGKAASQVLVELITSAQGGDVLKLDNTIDVSLYFTEQSRSSSKVFDASDARELINDVGFGSAEVSHAEAAIDVYFRPAPVDTGSPQIPHQPTIYTMTISQETLVIDAWDTSDSLNIPRLDSTFALDYFELSTIYATEAEARAAADTAEDGVVDIAVAFYYQNGTAGATNAIVVIDADDAGVFVDGFARIIGISADDISATNFSAYSY